MEEKKPYVLQMIKEAIDNLKVKATYSEIKNYINNKWSDVNESTINWSENKKPRLSNSNSNYDLLFSIVRGQVVKYNKDELEFGRFMKTVLQISLLIVFLFSCQSAVSQGNCKVLKPELAGSYNGKCKDGLANGKGLAIGTDRYDGQFLKGLPEGKGTYIWATGESYTGYWKEGKRNGEGEYRFFYKGNDSIIAGNWENDRYIGPIPEKPKIVYKTNVERYKFQKNGNLKNRVLIDIYQNGFRNNDISNFMISSSSGLETSLGKSIGYEEVSFPVSMRVTYTTWNKLRTATINVEFEFVISEPGDWIVDLNN